MHRLRHWLALSACALFASAAATAGDQAHSTTIIGPTNQLLSDGTEALQLGRFEEGDRLTLAGLELPNNPRHEAAAHSNGCAG